MSQADEVLVIRLEISPTSVLAHLEGEMDLVSCGHLTETLAVAGERAVTLDMSQVSFVDSSGLAALLRIRQQVPKFRVVRPSGPVERLLRLVGLYELFIGLEPA